MSVRGATSEELPSALACTEAAFEPKGVEPGFFGKAWAADENDTFELHRCFVDETAPIPSNPIVSWRDISHPRILATVRLCKREMQVGSVVLNLAGVADVATHPLHQRKGYASDILYDCVRHCEAAGFHLSFLFAAEAKRSFYSRFGYKSIQQFHRWFSLSTPSASSSPSITIRNFEPSMIPSINHIYSQYINGRCGPIARSIFSHEKTLRWCYDPHGFLVAFSGEEAVAYIRGSCRIESPANATQLRHCPFAELYEYGCLNGHEQTLVGLLSEFIRRSVEAGSEHLLAFSLPLEADIPTAWASAAETVGIGKLIGVEEASNLMVKIMKPIYSLMEALLPEFNRRLQSLPVASVSSSRLRLCVDSTEYLDISVTVSSGLPELDLSKSAADDALSSDTALLSLSSLALFNLVFGAGISSTAFYASLVPSASHILNALSPKPSQGFMWTRIDNF